VNATAKRATQDTNPHLERRYFMTEQTKPRSDLLTVPEAAVALRISRWRLYQSINRKQLRTIKIGRRRLVHVEDLQIYLDELRDQEVSR
jgi:excisionase family DNA binding protein